MKSIKLKAAAAIIALLCVLGAMAIAETPASHFEYRLQDGGAVITRFDSNGGEAVIYIPEMLDGYPAIGIQCLAFYQSSYFLRTPCSGLRAVHRTRCVD